MSNVENGLGGMFFKGYLVIEYFSVQHITQCTGVGSLESLHVDRVHFNCTLCSQDQSVHGNQYTFVFGFFCGGGNYGVVEIQRTVGT